MSKTITIDDDVYQLLVSLKEGASDSFTRVLRRHIHKPLDTFGELLQAHEQLPPPEVDPEVLDKVLQGRGRRSGGRK